jgi:hypothetical protein
VRGNRSGDSPVNPLPVTITTRYLNYHTLVELSCPCENTSNLRLLTVLDEFHFGPMRATPLALPPFTTLTLFSALFRCRFAPNWLWSEPSPIQSPLSSFGVPSLLSPPLIPVFAPCSSHLCAPRCCVGLVPCVPVYSWFCCISCLHYSGFGHAGPSCPNYIVSS